MYRQFQIVVQTVFLFGWVIFLGGFPLRETWLLWGWCADCKSCRKKLDLTFFVLRPEFCYKSTSRFDRYFVQSCPISCALLPGKRRPLRFHKEPLPLLQQYPQANPEEELTKALSLSQERERACIEQATLCTNCNSKPLRFVTLTRGGVSLKGVLQKSACCACLHNCAQIWAFLQAILAGESAHKCIFRVAQEPNRNRKPEPSEPFFPKPKAEPEPPEPFSRNRNRNRPFL